MQKVTIPVFLCCALFFVAALPVAKRTIYAPAAELKWLTLEQAAGKLQQNSKPVIIDLYTDWCGWCKVMDKKTYRNKALMHYVETNFYPVKINAETRDTLAWAGKKFAYNKAYRTNMFAVYLTNGNLSYPTTVIIPADGIPQAIPGYMKPEEMELILKYFGEGHYGKIPFAEFQQSFKPTWK
jgi:thioredoxin-related protein